MAIAYVQGPTENTSSSSTAVAKAYASNVASGSLLVCFINWSGATGSINSIADSLSQTWTAAVTKQGNGQSGAIYYFLNSAAGACTVTCTFAAAQSAELILYEFSGVQTSGSIDGTSSATAASGNSDSGNLTTTNANDLLFSGTSVSGSVSAGTASWTYATSGNFNGSEYRIVSSTGTYDATYTPGNAYIDVIAAFKSAGGTTALNATVTFNPATVLTLVPQLAEKPTVSFLPQTVLTLVPADIHSATATFNPATVLTLNATIQELTTVAVSPDTVLTLVPTLTGLNINATVGVNPSVSATFTPDVIHSATVGFSPGVTLTLGDNFFGQQTFPIQLPPGNETSNLQQ